MNMNSKHIKEFCKKLKAIDEGLDFEIFKDDGYMYKINDGMYRQDRVYIRYDGTIVLKLCVTKNTVPLIPATKVPMIVIDNDIYIGKDRADMVADVLKLCAEYLEELCKTSK